MKRRQLLIIAGGAAVGAPFVRLPASAQPLDLASPLRIRLFSNYEVARLVAGAVTADAPSGTLSGPSGSNSIGSRIVALSATPFVDLVAWTGTGQQIHRQYRGMLYVQLHGSTLTIVNEVDVETYVAAVMSAEVSPGWPQEALRAQAIAIRTYAARARVQRATRDYDLKDDTSSQVYPGTEGLATNFLFVAQDTTGQIIVAGGQPASVFYCSSCGGHTASSQELTGQPAPAYLQGIADVDPSGRAYCQNAPYFTWENSVTRGAMARIVELPADQLTDMMIRERWPDGRVRSISAVANNTTVTMDGREFYSRALGVLGYKVIPSALFDVVRSNDAFAFRGHGVGHGVGMCQWGAHGRATSGMNAAQILAAYFPGTQIVRGS